MTRGSGGGSGSGGSGGGVLAIATSLTGALCVRDAAAAAAASMRRVSSRARAPAPLPIAKWAREVAASLPVFPVDEDGACCKVDAIDSAIFSFHRDADRGPHESLSRYVRFDDLVFSAMPSLGTVRRIALYICERRAERGCRPAPPGVAVDCEVRTARLRVALRLRADRDEAGWQALMAALQRRSMLVGIGPHMLCGELSRVYVRIIASRCVDREGRLDIELQGDAAAAGEMPGVLSSAILPALAGSPLVDVALPPRAVKALLVAVHDAGLGAQARVIFDLVKPHLAAAELSIAAADALRAALA